MKGSEGAGIFPFFSMNSRASSSFCNVDGPDMSEDERGALRGVEGKNGESAFLYAISFEMERGIGPHSHFFETAYLNFYGRQ